MLTSRGALTAVLMPLLLFVSSVAMGGQDEKITICHVPPGDPANAHTIAVSPFALNAHLEHGDQTGVCAPVCIGNGSACSSDERCCSGICRDGTCARPCTANGSTCQSASDCCSNLCSAEGICASDCTASAEFSQPPCSVELPCCPGLVSIPGIPDPVEVGICISGLCFPDATCGLIGAACDPGNGSFCCFDYACQGGVCVAGAG